MKFGKQLEEYEQTEWKGHYIPYQELKHGLAKIKCVKSTPPPTPKEPESKGSKGKALGNQEPLIERADSESGYCSGTGLEEKLTAAINSVVGEAEQDKVWMRCCEREARRVGDFVSRGLDGLEAQLKDLGQMAETLRRKREGERSVSEGMGKIEEEPEELPTSLQPSFLRWMFGNFGLGDDDPDDGKKPAAAATSAEEEYLELRINDAMGRVADGSKRLQQFTELNHAALYKILKKHDKLLGNKDGLGKNFPKLVEETKLGDKSRFEQLDGKLRDFSMQNSQLEGLDASPEVARLALGLGSGQGPIGRAGGGASSLELAVSFFLGSSFSLFLAIAVLLLLPEDDPESYSLSYFLTPMPVFRVVFSVMLCLGCLGIVTRTCEQYDINHNFIMNVDPRSRVTPEFFYVRALGLTTIWILIFGMYVVDYKWEVLPTIWSDQGYNERSSGHFVLYPITLLVITFLGMIWPSRLCRNRYKVSVLGSMRRTIMAPYYTVYFHDNIVGDILTSLAKPLQDVPAAYCYLASPHPQEAKNVHRFRLKGDTCHSFVHHAMIPIIGGLPYCFRAMQCLRRWWDSKGNNWAREGDHRHLLNFGKYLASLSVVIVSATPLHEEVTIVFAVSAFATVYALLWDVLIDWGLSRKEMFPDQASQLDFKDTKSSSQDLKATDSAASATEKAKPQERHLSRRLYLVCCIFDVFARSTWVLTLMPITIVSRSIVGRVLLVSIISSIEILRRSMWAVIRIENEQVNNAGGFRALLWVPSKIGAEKKRVRSKTGTASI